MNTSKLRHAKKKSGCIVPDMAGLKHLVDTLWRNPAMDNRSLRKELEDHLPFLNVHFEEDIEGNLKVSFKLKKGVTLRLDKAWD